jgi:fatty acyl-CoA reductase
MSLACSLLEDWPNTYAFTKAMAEDLVRDKGVGLPIGVFRPAEGKNLCL